MTFDPGIDVYPAWTPDGRRLIFSSERSGSRNLFWQAADGTGTVERLSESVNTQDPSAVSPDGTRLIFQEITATGAGADLMQLDLDDVPASRGSAGGQPVGARRVTPLVQTPFTERNGIVSPDGRWLAYEANNSGQFEIYVRPYPEVSSGFWQVSTGGGNRPLWAPSSQELFYLSPTGALMRVGVDRGPTWAAGAPAKLLNEGYFTVPGGNVGRTYDISPDGQRFLMIKAGGGSDQAATPQIVVVQHWLEELKRLVPTNYVRLSLVRSVRLQPDRRDGAGRSLVRLKPDTTSATVARRGGADYGHRRRAALNGFSLPVFLRRCPYIISSTNSTHLNSRSCDVLVLPSIERHPNRPRAREDLRILDRGLVIDDDPGSTGVNRSTTWSASLWKLPARSNHVWSLKPVTSTTSVSPSQRPTDCPIQVSTGGGSAFPILMTRLALAYSYAMRMSLLPVCRI